MLVHLAWMNWKRMLAYVTGSVDEELLARNEYLATENRILRNQIRGRIRLTDPERISLASAAKRLGRKALEEVVQIVRPETILAWHRRLIAKKFDGSKNRPPGKGGSTRDEIEELVLQLARENRTWGYRRIAGALSNLGHEMSHQTVANVMKRHDIAPAPERGRTMSWRESEVLPAFICVRLRTLWLLSVHRCSDPKYWPVVSNHLESEKKNASGFKGLVT